MAVPYSLKGTLNPLPIPPFLLSFSAGDGSQCPLHQASERALPPTFMPPHPPLFCHFLFFKTTITSAPFTPAIQLCSLFSRACTSWLAVNSTVFSSNFPLGGLLFLVSLFACPQPPVSPPRSFLSSGLLVKLVHAGAISSVACIPPPETLKSQCFLQANQLSIPRMLPPWALLSKGPIRAAGMACQSAILSCGLCNLNAVLLVHSL